MGEGYSLFFIYLFILVCAPFFKLTIFLCMKYVKKKKNYINMNDVTAQHISLSKLCYFFLEKIPKKTCINALVHIYCTLL